MYESDLEKEGKEIVQVDSEQSENLPVRSRSFSSAVKGVACIMCPHGGELAASPEAGSSVLPPHCITLNLEVVAL